MTKKLPLLIYGKEVCRYKVERIGIIYLDFKIKIESKR